MKQPNAPTLKLYPELPEGIEPNGLAKQPEATDQGVQFRLNKISEIRNFLENEVDERDKLRKKVQDSVERML